MTTNATVEARHKDMAAKALTVAYKEAHPWAQLPDYQPGNNWLVCFVAQALANLEAARAENADLTNRLAEIDRIAGEHAWNVSAVPQCRRVATLASGHTPSPCPGCAAKDEAMEAFKADVSEVCAVAILHLETWVGNTDETGKRAADPLRRFIIPPADPLAEALNSAIDVFRDELSKGSRPSDARTAALAELKSRLGGA